MNWDKEKQEWAFCRRWPSGSKIVVCIKGTQFNNLTIRQDLLDLADPNITIVE